MALTRINWRLIKDTSVELAKLVDWAELIKRDWSVAFTWNTDQWDYKITNLKAWENDKDAVNKKQLDDAVWSLSAWLEYKWLIDLSSWDVKLSTLWSTASQWDFYKVKWDWNLTNEDASTTLALNWWDMVIINQDVTDTTDTAVDVVVVSDKVDNTEQVTSVAWKTWNVELEIADIDSLQDSLDAKIETSVLDTDNKLDADSDEKVATQKAVKAYIDTAIASFDDAYEISYDNSNSWLDATDVQEAIDEIGWRVDDLESSDNWTIVNNEVPDWTKDWSNKDFTLANTPKSWSVQLYLMGTRLAEWDDFSVSDNTISFSEAPFDWEHILADYRY